MFVPQLTGRDREPGSPRPMIRFVTIAVGLLAAGVVLATDHHVAGVIF